MATAAEIKSFIQKLGRLAVAECNNRIASGRGFVFPSVCIAQAALETGWGSSSLMTRANAYFGIKAGGSWTGAVYRADTWEVANGSAYNTTANFRAYPSLAASVTDYYDLIVNNSRYSKGVSKGSDKSKWLTPKQCITAIWSGGYATDTLYVEKIMSTINARGLAAYDNMVTGEGSTALPETDKDFNASDLEQGILLVTDGGRTISKVNDVTTVCLNWEKAFTVENSTVFTVQSNINEDEYEIYIARLLGDTATISGPFKNGDTIATATGEKIGFYIDQKDNPNNLIKPPITPADLNGFTLSFTTGAYAGGTENYSGTIAYFVKIE